MMAGQGNLRPGTIGGRRDRRASGRRTTGTTLRRSAPWRKANRTAPCATDWLKSPASTRDWPRIRTPVRWAAGHDRSRSVDHAEPDRRVALGLPLDKPVGREKQPHRGAETGCAVEAQMPAMALRSE